MLSERLRQAMDDAGVSQAELARACGVKPPSVHGWLSGKAKFLRGENLLTAARVLRVSQDWLATGKGPKNPAELMQGYTPMPAPGGGTVPLDAAIAVLADAIERSPYKGQDNLLGMLAYMGKSPGDEINRQSLAALLQNKQQPDARTKMAA